MKPILENLPQCYQFPKNYGALTAPRYRNKYSELTFRIVRLDRNK